MSQNSDDPEIASLASRIEIMENFYNKMEHLITHAQDGIEKCFERIEKLEQAYKDDAEVAKDIIYTGAKRSEEIRQIKSECEWRDSFKKLICDSITTCARRNGEFENLLCDYTAFKNALRVNGIEEAINLVKLINKKICDLEELIYEVKAKQRECDRKPHKCPLCEGAGKVNLLMHEKGTPIITKGCDACEGKGIVWG